MAVATRAEVPRRVSLGRPTEARESHIIAARRDDFMRIAVSHHTTKDKARQKVEQRLSSLLSQFGGHAEDMKHEWLGDTLRFKGKARGMKVEGTVEITDAEVIIDGKLPLIALPFEGRVREAVLREADSMFRTA
jgi:hypothetical protein